MPIYVRSCVHMWVPTAHLPPDHIAERAVESMLPATTALRTRTQPPPSPRRYARARAIARRGSYTVHSCANETDVATQRMRTCRSQCNGDRIHPVRGGTDLLRLLGRLLVGHRLLGLPNHDELQSCKARRGPTRPRFRGVRKGRKISPRDYGRDERASKFDPCDGAGVQVRGAKPGGDARWRRACATRGVKPSVAAHRKPQRSTRACGI
jgi:hypothetical protein